MARESEAREANQSAAREPVADDAAFTPDAVKETFSSWEASALTKTAAEASETQDANKMEAANETPRSIASSPGAPGNFGDTPGLNGGDMARASASEPAGLIDAETGTEPTPSDQTPARHRAEKTASTAAAMTNAPVKGRRRTVAAVEDSLRPRVEKWRDVSVGMLDDASEDSGLRFIIIALAMFLVFLLFLIISNVLK